MYLCLFCILRRNSAGPWYFNIGDGGNKEGLCRLWLDQVPSHSKGSNLFPRIHHLSRFQPSYSVFRKSAYGFSNLRICTYILTFLSLILTFCPPLLVNETHAQFSWFENPDSVNQNIGYQTMMVRPFPR